jgi:hypothetical protein
MIKLLKILTESRKETLDEFISRFERESSNPDFISNHLKVPNFRLELTHDGSVRVRDYECSLPNKCETNTYNFIKSMVENNSHRYFPVSGWAFSESATYFEHFWVYDSLEDIFLDVTPMGKDFPYAYGGVINFDINDDILNSEKYSDIPFLLGKAHHSLYKNYVDRDVNPLTKRTNKVDLLDFLKSNPKYKELYIYVSSMGNKIDNLEDLKVSHLPKLEDARLEVRNNRDWDYYTKIINQIKALHL